MPCRFERARQIARPVLARQVDQPLSGAPPRHQTHQIAQRALGRFDPRETRRARRFGAARADRESRKAAKLGAPRVQLNCAGGVCAGQQQRGKRPAECRFDRLDAQQRRDDGDVSPVRATPCAVRSGSGRVTSTRISRLEEIGGARPFSSAPASAPIFAASSHRPTRLVSKVSRPSGRRIMPRKLIMSSDTTA
jgi:hypothetical protein